MSLRKLNSIFFAAALVFAVGLEAGEKIGAYITYSSGDMNTALYGEYAQMPSYGFTRARYGAVNFATGFTGAAYDQSFSWTINPEMYHQYSSNFLMDEADFVNA